jgi:hypothetical protein
MLRKLLSRLEDFMDHWATITCNELHGTFAHTHRDIESDGFDLIKRQTGGGAGGGAGGAHELMLPRRSVSIAFTGSFDIVLGLAPLWAMAPPLPI